MSTARATGFSGKVALVYLVPAAILMVLALAIGSARAEPPASGAINAEILVLHATQADGGGSIDPVISKMPQLTKPPFSAYNTYKLLDRKTLPLEPTKSGNYTLPNGRVLQVTFVNSTPEKRFRIKAAINQSGGSAFLKLLEVTAAPNETFFVGGQSYQGGSLVLAITIRP